ncbi:hypothetical protein F5Y02DRAFT_360813 [Annulohypoxylon stygium]|nr:hypothetical protein F5Y02DRAFT_360813 [Annulohypoxylon stygium]
MQVIGNTHEIIGFCKLIYQGRFISAYDGENIASLSVLSAELQTHYGSVNPQTSDEKQLADIAAQALEERISFLTSHDTKGHLAQTLSVAVKTGRRKRRLDILERYLRSYRQMMESHLLTQFWYFISKRNDAIELQQRQSFKEPS